MNTRLAPFPLAFLALSLSALVLPGCTRSRYDYREFVGSWETYAERTETREVALGSEGILSINSSGGEIEVDLVESGPGELVAVLRCYAKTQELADSELAACSLAVEDRPDELRVDLERDGGLSKARAGEVWTTVDYRIRVPRGVRVDVRTDLGDVAIRGNSARTRVGSSYGDVKVTGARGDVEATSSSGNVHVRDVQADRVVARSGYGNVLVEEAVAPTIEAGTESGNIELASVQADSLSAKTSYGDVVVRNARGDVVAHSSSGSIVLEDAAEGTHELVTGYGSVSASRVSGHLSAVSTSGKIEVRIFDGSLVADSGYGTVDVEGDLHSVRASSGSGNVRITATAGSTMEADWELRSSYGNVVLQVPVGFDCQVDAHTGYGEITSEFDVLVEAGLLSDATALQGTIGAGGRTIALVTSSGDIRLRKLGGE